MGSEQIRKIVTLQLQLLAKRLEKRGYHLSWEDGVVEALYEEGFDPVYGARPIKRAVQRLVENPLSVQLLSGAFAPDASIHLIRSGDQIIAQ